MLSILVAAGARGVVRGESLERERPRVVLPARTTWGVPTRPSYGRFRPQGERRVSPHIAVTGRGAIRR
jgi:hypothetical protein